MDGSVPAAIPGLDEQQCLIGRQFPSEGKAAQPAEERGAIFSQNGLAGRLAGVVNKHVLHKLFWGLEAVKPPAGPKILASHEGWIVVRIKLSRRSPQGRVG